MTDSICVSPENLKSFTAKLFEAADVSAGEATIVANSLVEANLRGHASHGVVRVPDYVRCLREQEVIADAPLETINETAAILVADAKFGFGQVQCVRLIERLVPKARELGIACGTLLNCGHVGRLGEWVEKIAEEGLAGLITVNDNGVLKCVAPPGGVEPTISTNPMAIGVPTGDGPLVVDISTSVVANGKIKVAQIAGEECPPGWLLDANGEPTTDPAVRFTDPRGSILPVGGEDHGYKGFGLGLLLDILVGGLSGGLCPPADASAAGTNNVLLVIWNPARFSGERHFLGETDKLIDFVRNSRRKEGVEKIQLPGDRGNEYRNRYLQEGIPLDEGTWESLKLLAHDLGVNVPQVG